MSDRYLIDGYNLLHILGALQGKVGPRALERGRRELLERIADGMREAVANVTVVFDARHAPAHAKATLTHRGIQVLFAIQQESADDLIEDLIRQDNTPQKLIVVSDDHRLQRAAKRRPARVLGCTDFLELLLRPPVAPTGPTSAKGEKETSQSEQEKQHWLKEFGHLQNDPSLRELFQNFERED